MGRIVRWPVPAGIVQSLQLYRCKCPPSIAAERMRVSKRSGWGRSRSAEDSDCSHSRVSARPNGPSAGLAEILSVTAAHRGSIVHPIPGFAIPTLLRCSKSDRRLVRQATLTGGSTAPHVATQPTHRRPYLRDVHPAPMIEADDGFVAAFNSGVFRAAAVRRGGVRADGRTSNVSSLSSSCPM